MSFAVDHHLPCSPHLVSSSERTVMASCLQPAPSSKQSPLPFISTVTADDHSSELMKSAAPPKGERESERVESQETIEPPKTAAAVENTTASSGLSLSLLSLDGATEGIKEK